MGVFDQTEQKKYFAWLYERKQFWFQKVILVNILKNLKSSRNINYLNMHANILSESAGRALSRRARYCFGSQSAAK